MSSIIEKIERISLGQSEEDMIKVLGQAIKTKKVSDSVTIKFYKHNRVWLRKGRVVQISIYSDSDTMISKLQLGKVAPETDPEMGSKYYSSDDEVWKYTKLPNVSFTVKSDNAINEIFIFTK